MCFSILRLRVHYGREVMSPKLPKQEVSFWIAASTLSHQLCIPPPPTPPTVLRFANLKSSLIDSHFHHVYVFTGQVEHSFLDVTSPDAALHHFNFSLGLKGCEMAPPQHS